VAVSMRRTISLATVLSSSMPAAPVKSHKSQVTSHKAQGMSFRASHNPW